MAELVVKSGGKEGGGMMALSLMESARSLVLDPPLPSPPEFMMRCVDERVKPYGTNGLPNVVKLVHQ